jgi:hypothetical protein
MSLILRGTKGAALTHAELDNNQVWLKSRDIVSASVDVKNNLILTKDDFSYYSVPLSGIGTTISGLTFSGNVLTITQSDGSNVSVNISSVDIRVTDLIYSGSTLYLNQSDGSQESVFIPQFTGGTVNGYTIFNNGLSANTFTTNSLTLNGVTITGFTDYVFTGNTSGDCITDIFVSNINSCSPLHIQPVNTGNVLIGENGGVNVGIGTSTPNAKLHINNITTGNTVLFEDDTSPDPSPFVIDNGGKVGIGTTTPSEKLDVYNGFIKTNQGVIVDGGTNNGVRFNGSGFSRFAIDGGFKLNAAFTEGFKFTNGVYDFFNYDQSGFGDTFQIGNGLIKGRTTGTTDVYLGINVLGTPSSTLEVNGKTKTTNLQVTSGSPQVGYVLTATDTNGNMTWQAPSSGNTSVGLNQIAFGNSINGNITSSSDFFRNSSNGYVGIGNNSPSSKLHISTSGLTGTSYSVLKIENKGDGTNYLDASIILSSGLFSNPSFDTARLYTTFDGTSIGDGRFTIQTPNESTYLFEDAFTVKNKRVGIGTNFPSERLEISGKTKTTTLQVTTNPTPGYVLTSDASGNATWQPQNTFTGGTINGPTNFTGGLSANTLVVNGVIITGFTDTNTFVTGFTYDNNNKFVISQNNGQPDLPVYINTMSGLTVNGNVTATTLNATSSLTVRGSATTRGVLPETDNTYSLGSTSQRWASLYTKEVRLYESRSGSAADNDYISILAPNDLALTPNPAWSLVLPYNSGSTFNLLGVYDGSSNTSNTSWFTLSAGTNVSLNQVAFSGGSVITINSTAVGGGTFTGGTVSGPTNFTNGLTANTLTVGTFQVGRKYSSSQSFTGSVLKTITHNLNTQDVIAQLWDSSNNLLNGATITANNVNSVDITVASTATYKVVIIG